MRYVVADLFGCQLHLGLYFGESEVALEALDKNKHLKEVKLRALSACACC